jgi:hypothetical protein
VTFPSIASSGGVRNAARPTPRRPTRSFDDARGSFPEAPFFELVVLIEVGSMLGMLSSVVPISGGLPHIQRRWHQSML